MFDKLKFSKPSEEWLSGTPVGNGRIGFMQYGVAGREIFALNHDSLFRHKNTKEINSAHLIPKIRELIKHGKRSEAEELFRDLIRPLNKDCNPYQPFCDLIFELDGTECTDYLKELDMENGILNVSYICDGTCVKYECFADAVSGLIVIKLDCDKPMSADITLCRMEDAECNFSSHFDGPFAYTEGVFDEGIRFCSALRFVSDGELVGSKLKNFTSLEAYIALAVGDNASECSRAQIEALDGYGKIKEAHIADHSALYDRVSLTFDCAQTDSENVYERTLSGDISPEIYGYLFNNLTFILHPA